MEIDQIILAVAALLFLIALVALTVWAFRAFVLSGRGGSGFLRHRDRRLGVIEAAAVDGRRKLLLIKRDDVEHLIMTGGPVDVVIETGIKGPKHLEPPLQDVIIAHGKARPTPDLGKS